MTDLFPLGILMAASLAALAANEAHAADTDRFIRLAQTRCYGSCPAFEMTIHADGSYVFEGEAFVRVHGRGVGELGPEAFAAAEAALRQYGFESLPERITRDNEAACPYPSTDSAAATITVGSDMGESAVTYYFGCDSRVLIPFWEEVLLTSPESVAAEVLAQDWGDCQPPPGQISIPDIGDEGCVLDRAEGIVTALHEAMQIDRLVIPVRTGQD